jgi:hypothetical protein
METTETKITLENLHNLIKKLESRVVALADRLDDLESTVEDIDLSNLESKIDDCESAIENIRNC